MFLDIFTHGTDAVRVVANALPDNVQYVRAFCSDRTGWGRISLVLSSESWDALHDGAVIPTLPEPLFERVEKS